MKCKVLKPGLSQRRNGSLIDLEVGDVGEFTAKTFEWLHPGGFLERISEPSEAQPERGFFRKGGAE
jgi:hypothetical protein